VLGLVLWNQEQREYKEGGLSNKLKKLDPFSSKGGETFERIKNLFEKFLP